MGKLAQIQAPIAQDLEAFNRYYEEVMTVPSRALGLILRYVLKGRGKQLRPMLVYLAAGACGGITETTPVAAAMVELVHNASLLHDDVVDQADLRRGLPSVYKLWKAQGAVLTGDYMLGLGLRLAVETGQYRLLDFMNSAVQAMSTSELEQLQRARRQVLDEEGYYEVIQGKTAALLAVCTQSGAYSAGASEEVVETLRAIGENIGMAFQIRDDILDFSPNPGIGKKSGNDLKEGKITLPVIYALDALEGRERSKFSKLILKAKRDDASRRAALRFVQESEGITRAEANVREFTESAVRLIESLPETHYSASLRLLAEYLVTRKK